MGKAREDSELLARINAHPKGKHFRDLGDIPAPIFNARISQAQQTYEMESALQGKHLIRQLSRNASGNAGLVPVSVRESGLRSMSGVSRNY